MKTRMTMGSRSDGEAPVRASDQSDPAEPSRLPELDARLAASVLAHASESVLITDARLPDTAITYANPAFESHTGYALDEVLGRTPRFLQGPDTSKATLRVVREATERFEPVRVELLNYKKDGTPFWVDLSIVPAFDAAGVCTHFISLQRDITLEKATQAQNQRVAGELDRTRTALRATSAELEEQADELQQFRDRVQVATRAQATFAANISHELRTPLNGVLGIASLLRDTDLNDEQREYLGMIRSSGEALLSVLGDVLDLGKVNEGLLELDRRRFSVRRVVEDALAMVAMAAHGKDLELTHLLAEDVPEEVWGDDARLRQVLVALLGNAVKFTARGRVDVRVAYDIPDPHRGRLRFEVEDTGPGIDPALHPALFDPFFQADDSSTRDYGGAGLGLTLARGLIERMGGGVSVESALGRGSTFRFDVLVDPTPELPIARPFEGFTADVRADSPSMKATLTAQLVALGFTPVGTTDRGRPDLCVVEGLGIASSDARARIRLVTPHMTLERPLPGELALLEPVRLSALESAARRALGLGPKTVDLGAQTAERQLRILVAEDNRVNERVIVGMLQRLGHAVVVARDGQRALERLQDDHFDLVLMDLQMPEMDGLEATVRFRAGGGTTPVVALTANAQDPERERCLQRGMNDYLTKPVHRARLLAVLRRYGGLGESAEAAPHAAEAPR